MADVPIANFEGMIYMPSDEGYEVARRSWLRNYDAKPVLVAEVRTIEDVQKVVRYANAHNLPIAIQVTGHGAVKSIDGAVLIKTHAMKRFELQPHTKTATFEPGVIIGDLVSAANAYSLSPITGDSPYVGAMGFTLGGGHGWLSRQFGFAASSIIEAKLITSSGELVTTNAIENPDLLWALKGGSGNFGVVVSLTVRLHPVQAGFGGAVYFGVEHAQELLSKYSSWALALPEQYTVFLQALTLPAIPQLPTSISGKRVVMLQLFFNDAAVTAKPVLQNFLDSLKVRPLENFTSETTYNAFLHAAPTLPPTAALDVSGLQSTITNKQIPELAEHMQASESFHPILQIRPWHGTLAKPAPTNLLQYREIGFSVYATISIGNAKTDKQTERAFADLAQHITSYASDKAFINFTANKKALESAYGGTAFKKLQAVKKAYDPKNLFRLGHTIEII